MTQIFKYTCYSLVLLTIFSCAQTKPNKQRIQFDEVRKEIVQVANYVPEIRLKNINEGVSVRVQPVDAQSLDIISHQLANNTGNVELSFAARKKSDEAPEVDPLNAEERLQAQRRRQIFDYLDEMVGEGNINQLSANALKSVVEDLPINSGLPAPGTTTDCDENFNPYKFGCNYLSVFEIAVENKSQTTQRIKLTDILIVHGPEQLYPLNSEYFENQLRGKDQKLLNAKRMNFPDQLLVPPGSEVKKYLAVPAIQYADGQNNISINIVDESKTASFDFAVESRREAREITYKQFEYRPQFSKKEVLGYYMYTEIGDVRAVSNNGALIYVSENYLKTASNAYGILTLKDNRYCFCREEGFSFNNFTTTRSIRLDCERPRNFRE